MNAYWRADWKCYAREYAKGTVLVNPFATPTTVAFAAPRRVVSAQGGEVVSEEASASGPLSTTTATSVTISAHSACVVLR